MDGAEFVPTSHAPPVVVFSGAQEQNDGNGYLSPMSTGTPFMM